MTNPLIAAAVALIVVGCGTSNSPNLSQTVETTSTSLESSAPAENNNPECPEYAGSPVAWPRLHEVIDGDIVVYDRLGDETRRWPIEDSHFEVASAYWAQEPSHISDVDSTARSCIDADTRWMLIARPPGADTAGWDIPFGNPADFDQANWDQVIAHPWRLDRIGQVGSADEEPYYRGVVRFTDQLAVTSSACDTRPNVVLFRGNTLAPIEWPMSEQTMVCVPPPGIEPVPPEELDQAKLPIAGVPSIENDELVIVLGETEGRYVSITEDELVAAFDRDAFFELGNPLTVLERWEATSFDDLNAATSTATTEP